MTDAYWHYWFGEWLIRYEKDGTTLRYSWTVREPVTWKWTPQIGAYETASGARMAAKAWIVEEGERFSAALSSAPEQKREEDHVLKKTHALTEYDANYVASYVVAKLTGELRDLKQIKAAVQALVLDAPAPTLDRFTTDELLAELWRRGKS